MKFKTYTLKLLFLIAIMLIPSAGFSEEIMTLYDFNNGYGVDKWVSETGVLGLQFFPPPLNLETVNGSIEDVTLIQNIDNLREDTADPGPTDYAAMQFIFTITNSDIVNITPYFEGFADTSSSLALYIWNYTTSAFEQIDVNTGSTADIILSADITANISDYINSQDNKLTILAAALSSSQRLYCDYVKVEVTGNEDPPSVTLTSPAGGEVWGGTHQITWTSDGYWNEDFVTISYSVNGGGNFADIISGTVNDGSFLWNTWDINDTQSCLIRIEKANEPGINDTSNNLIVDNTSPSPAEIISVQVISASQINWTAGTAADPNGVEYQFSRQRWNGTGWINDGSSNWQVSREYSPSNLLENTRYRLKVDVRDQVDPPNITYGMYDNSSARYTYCNIPANVSAAPLTNSSIQLNVDSFPNDNQGLSGYEWTVTENPGGGSGSSNRTYVDSGLLPNRRYTYEILYINGDGVPTNSIPISRYSGTNQPNNLAVTGVTTDSITISWSANGNPVPTAYRAVCKNYSTGVIVEDTGYIDNMLNHTFTNLAVNYPYRLEVWSQNVDQTYFAEPSLLEPYYTLANPPALDENGTFSEVTNVSIQVNWGDNSNPSGTEYLCENITHGTNSGWITDTHWVSGGLEVDNEYYFQVRARSGNPPQQQTIIVDLGSEITQLYPSIILNQPAGGESVSGDYLIRWQRRGYWDVNHLGVDILYKIGNGSWQPLIQNQTEDEYTWHTDQYNDSDQYYIRLVKSDDPAIKKESNVFTVDNSPPAHVGCLEPAPNAENVSITTALTAAVVNFAVAGQHSEGGYQIQISLDETFPLDALTDSGWISQPVWVLDEKLKEETTYYWRVRARDKANNETAWMGEIDSPGFCRFITGRIREVYFTSMGPGSSELLNSNAVDLSIILSFGHEVDLLLEQQLMRCMIGYNLEDMLIDVSDAQDPPAGGIASAPPPPNADLPLVYVLTANLFVEHSAKSGTFTLSNHSMLKEGGETYIRWVYDNSIYSDIYTVRVAPNNPPTVEILQPVSNSTVGAQPVIKISAHDDGLGLQPESIFIEVLDMQGNQVWSTRGNEGSIYDEKTGSINTVCDSNNLQENVQYRLHVEVSDRGYTASLTAVDNAMFKIAGGSVAELIPYPSPFNPKEEAMTIRYSIREEARVTIHVYDMAHDLVDTIIKNESRSAGLNVADTWDGKDYAGSSQANGVYFIELIVKDSSGEHREYKPIAILAK
ncbi:MAG: hypothetical protein ABII23_03420 [bacterium]